VLPRTIGAAPAGAAGEGEPAPVSGGEAEAVARAAPVCAPRVDALPGSRLFAAADPRLAGSAVVVVEKQRRRLALYRGGALAGCWRVALARPAHPERSDREAVVESKGAKQVEGDLRTPEGWYRTSDRPTSRFHRAIAVHYPNLDDAERGVGAGDIDAATRDEIAAALADGVEPPQHTALGGEILIHGGGSAADWTLGCVALDDADIDALRARLPDGQATDLLILP